MKWNRIKQNNYFRGKEWRPTSSMVSEQQTKMKDKLGLSSAKLSRTKFVWYEVIFEVVWKQLAVKKICGQKRLVKTFISPKKFGSKQIDSQKMLCQKDFGSK